MRILIFFLVLAAGLSGCNRSPEFYFTRANSLLSSGKEADALENYNKAILLKRNFPEALVARGMLYEPHGAWRAAAELKAAVRAPKQYWRAPPRGAESIFRGAQVGQR